MRDPGLVLIYDKAGDAGELPGDSTGCFSYEGVLNLGIRNPPVCLDVSFAHVLHFPSQLCPSLRQ